MRVSHLFSSWAKVLGGHTPLLSIEITKECPLRCPGCYAYGQDHLGGANLRSLSDFRGDELVDGILQLVEKHQPLQVSLVGGEPMMRHRELSKVLPVLNAQKRHVMVVTSGVVPVPMEWMAYEYLVVAVSIDGLPEHHDLRRAPATYERILRNIEGRKVNIHGTLTRPMLNGIEYLDQYVRFWDARPEVRNIWISLYSPQVGEESPEMLGPEDRRNVRDWLPLLDAKYKKLLAPDGYARAILQPPTSPAECAFAQTSVNYTADLRTRVEPCVFGGNPDCSQCGCSASLAAHWIQNMPVAAGLRVRHLLSGSVRIGKTVRRWRGAGDEKRWAHEALAPEDQEELIQIR